MAVLGYLIDVSVWLWIAAEVVMQWRQYRSGGKAVRTEWRSLAVIGVAAAVGEVLAVLALSALPGADFGGRTATLAAALLVLWAGVGFRLWAIRSLGRFFRGVVHVQADHQVVQSGPYRVLRHPSYTGVLVAILGTALTFGNVASIVLLTGCNALGVLYRIRVEEAVLNAELGDAYREYAGKTARLVPGLW
ncbi:protein-S-isoprenylcysteine O-methyltransferase Ste14 [Kitasatospora sp. MAP12-15]|uniref:methyltransferase family protein n=1 Tax=unclassified Kitasatospora TaxID=2633591 RepID=UPI002476D363|nr:isoprenylcysteine carboxylmethyltransferase family protein [Kitasatospora sp. MAP12-44]MDH6109650.1 protein-S-isoprenylcysteine O-methyltransferase Ste14 [Kitasatospora sp. MAP12-44]